MDCINDYTYAEQIIPACPTRNSTKSTIDPNDAHKLRLKIHEYHSKSIKNNKVAIFVPGNGFVLSMYLPFLNELLPLIQVESIYLFSAVNQGFNAILNEEILGIENNWYDNANDLLQFIHHYKLTENGKNVFILGHSYGGTSATILALNHSFLSGLMLIDPMIQPHMPLDKETGKAFVHTLAAKRKDIWPSREEARSKMLKNKYFASWRTDVLDLFIRDGLRDLPTPAYPDKTGVTLTTSKFQESYTFVQQDFFDPNILIRPEITETYDNLHRLKVPNAWIVSSSTLWYSESDKIEKSHGIGELTDWQHDMPFQVPQLLASKIAQYWTNIVAQSDERIRKRRTEDVSVVYNEFWKSKI